MIAFLASPFGGALVLLAAVALVAALLVWAFRSRHLERWAAVTAAVLLSVPLGTLYAWLVLSQTWVGRFFEQIPLVVQLALVMPILVVGLTVWLLGYGWLTTRTRHPLVIYGVIGALIVLVAALADTLELSRGLVLLGPDRTVWFDALLGVLVIALPILLFEAVRRGLARDVLP